MRILFLDDRTVRLEQFKARVEAIPGTFPVALYHASTARDAVDALVRERPFDFVFLDFDLNDEEHVAGCHHIANCGMLVAMYLASGHTPLGKIVIHSANSGASRMMRDLLKTAGYDAVRRPFEEYNWVDLLNPAKV